MDDNDSDPNASMFPLFNFDALKQGSANIPLNISFGESLLKPPTDTTIARAPVVPAAKPPAKKPGRKGSKKKSLDSKSSLATMKEILEDDQAGVPMLNDAKMKEEKLKKMREGKAKKKEQRAEGLTQSIEPQKEFETLAAIMPSVGGKPQALFGLDFEQEELPGMRIVFKDGKPVVEDTSMIEFGNKNRNDKLTLVDDSKPHKLTSMSFRKKNHTKQWSKQETEKLYKAVEIFGSDFSMITKLFPERNRSQIKNKLRKEEKENPKEVENAFRKHEVAGKRSLVSRIEDLGRKQLKAESASDQFSSLENLPHHDALNTQNRTTSTCSLDSMDMSILNDLKAIFTQESQSRSGNILDIQDKLKKDIAIGDFISDKLKNEAAPLTLGFLQTTDKEKKKNELEADQEQPKIEYQEGKRTNLLLGLLNKQQTNI